MNRAIKGRNFEHKVRQLFESAGYSCIRGVGSKGAFLDEKVDLVCTTETRSNQLAVQLTIVGVQCKVRAR